MPFAPCGLCCGVIRPCYTDELTAHPGCPAAGGSAGPCHYPLISYPYTLIPLYPYTLYPYTLISYTLTPLHPYTLIPLYPYTLIPLYPYSRTPPSPGCQAAGGSAGSCVGRGGRPSLVQCETPGRLGEADCSPLISLSPYSLISLFPEPSG